MLLLTTLLATIHLLACVLAFFSVIMISVYGHMCRLTNNLALTQLWG